MDADEEIDQKDLPGRLGALVALKKSRGDHDPHDKDAADFIQRYVIAAVRCFEEKENPTMALMALRPFKVGNFDLAIELQALLFDNSQPVEKTLEDFKNRLGEIILSLPKDGPESDNSPYLIQHAMGLQMLGYAALRRADKAGIDIQKFASDLLDTVKANNSGINFGAVYPLWKLIDPEYKATKKEYVAYQPQSNQLLDEPKAKAPFDDSLQEISEVNRSQKVNKFKLVTFIKQSKFAEGLAEIEPIFLSRKFLESYFTMPGAPGVEEINPILDWLVQTKNPIEQQIFALKVLNRILQNADEAKTLFENTNSNLFKALLAFKPRSPESTLELGKLFRTLAGHAAAYQPEFRALLDQRIKQAETKPVETRTSSSNRNKFIAVAGILFVFAVVATALSIIFFPLLPLYAGITISIAAGVFGLAALSTLAGAFFSKEPVSVQKIPNTSEEPSGPLTPSIPEEPSGPGPMIQTNFKTWLEVYGYDPDKLDGETLIDIFERAPHLSNSIDIFDDAFVFKDILALGNWSIFERLVHAFDEQARPKLSEIVIELGGKCFRRLVTDLEKLKIFCSYLPPEDEEDNRDVLWRYISKESDYLEIFTENATDNDEMQETIPPSQELYQQLTGLIQLEALKMRPNLLPRYYHKSPFSSATESPKVLDSTGQDWDLVEQLDSAAKVPGSHSS